MRLPTFIFLVMAFFMGNVSALTFNEWAAENLFDAKPATQNYSENLKIKFASTLKPNPKPKIVDAQDGIQLKQENALSDVSISLIEQKKEANK
jgi:hypothetical protein